MIKEVKGTGTCVTKCVDALPFIQYGDERHISPEKYIILTPKSKDELLKLKEITPEGRLRDHKVGVVEEMQEVISRGIPIIGYILKRDSKTWYVKFGNWYYCAEWFNYNAGFTADELKEFT